MKTRFAVIVGMGLTLALLGFSLFLYPSLPDRIPTHWNLHGKVDGYGSKTWAVFFGPALTALFTAMMLLLPQLSPKNFDVESFLETFNYVFLLCTGLFGFMHLVMLQAALHPGLDVGRTLISGIFVFLALMGNVMGRVRRNFWVGVRTPWTLASDRVWFATHRMAAKWMVAAGLFGALGIWLGMPVWIATVVMVASLLIPAFYSLVLYKQEERSEAQG